MISVELGHLTGGAIFRLLAASGIINAFLVNLSFEISQNVLSYRPALASWLKIQSSVRQSVTSLLSPLSISKGQNDTSVVSASWLDLMPTPV